MLGNEVRPFEINHDNFAMEAFGTARIRSSEIAVAFHHVSRHLSDRANPNIIAWNVLDFRAMRQFKVGESHIDAELAAGHVLQSTFVDYTWTSDLYLTLHRPSHESVGVLRERTRTARRRRPIEARAAIGSAAQGWKRVFA